MRNFINLAVCYECYKPRPIIRLTFFEKALDPRCEVEYAACCTSASFVWEAVYPYYEDYIIPTTDPFFAGPYIDYAAVKGAAPPLERSLPLEPPAENLSGVAARVLADPFAWRVQPTRHTKYVEPYYRISKEYSFWFARGFQATVLHAAWRQARKRTRSGTN